MEENHSPQRTYSAPSDPDATADSARLRCAVSVSFEYVTRPPETHRIAEIQGNQPQTIARMAISEAKKTLKPRSWCSIVCVIERLGIDETDWKPGWAETTETAENV